MGEEQRNLFIALGLILVITLGWQALVLGPAEQERRELFEAEQALIAEQTGSDLPGIASAVETAPISAAVDRDEALTSAQRIEIESDAVIGSFSLTGARLDDLRLRRYTEEVDGDELVSLMNPAGSANSLYARDGWVSSTPGITNLPGATTEWTLMSGNRLTPDTPIMLSYDNGAGLDFVRTVSMGEDYVFEVTDTVTNRSGETVDLSRYGLVRQGQIPDDREPNLTVFEGAIAVVGDHRIQRKYDKLEDGEDVQDDGTGGWVGITSQYWLAAVMPDQSRAFTAELQGTEVAGGTAIQANYLEMAQALESGASLTSTSHIFAGAKEMSALNHVQNDLGISKFDMAVNWGWLWFVVRPIVWLLTALIAMTGHFGAAIMVLTLILKLILFPLSYKAFASTAKMKEVAPKMKEIKERYASDKQKQQEATIELYKTEKINPLAGCLPMLPQLPIFFALYQALFNSLDMRHASFPGWISDMAAPDPTTMWNLFGLLPFEPTGIFMTGFIAIGLWPILNGITMAAQQALNPPPDDPMQAKIFAMLPIIFVFVMAQFAAGLVIYWAWNSFLTVIQQYVIMRHYGNETQLDKFISKTLQRFRGSER